MRVFSGIQPTGEIHIGNYLGAIKQWLELQEFEEGKPSSLPFAGAREKNECIFCIVDLHALTTPYNPKTLQNLIFEKTIAYLAAGIEPEKSIIFVQSQIKEHTELTWLLSTCTPIGDLLRMTQYKEKAKKFKKNLNAGLLNYPILMAADILLYQTNVVPVGKDQAQHVEFARTIARKFNQKFGQTFVEPKVQIPKTGAKIMSLTNPRKKMSKTDAPASYINLFDSPEKIQEKIMKAVTDTGKQIKYSISQKPGISNLLTIFSLFSGEDIKKIEKKFKNKGYAEFKKDLSKLLIEKLEPFRKKRKELLSREVYVRDILDKGSRRAQIIAQSTIAEVRKKMGLA